MSTKTSNTSTGSQKTSPGTRLNFFQEIFPGISGFRQLPLLRKIKRNIIKKVNKNFLTENDQNWHKVPLKVNSWISIFALCYIRSIWKMEQDQKYIVKNMVLSKWVFSSKRTPKNDKYYHLVNSYMVGDDFSICF